MNRRTEKVPGPDHPISIQPDGRRVVVRVAGQVIADSKSVNAAWTYETPYAAVSIIKEYPAFYPTRVDSIEETAA